MARSIIVAATRLAAGGWTGPGKRFNTGEPAFGVRHWAQVLALLPGLFLLAGSSATTDNGAGRVRARNLIRSSVPNWGELCV